MPQVTGRIVGNPRQRDPLIDLRLRAPAAGPRMPSVRVQGVLVDTGFNDTLILPEHAIRSLATFLTPPTKDRIHYTETEWEWYDMYLIEIFWMGRWQEQEVYVRTDVTPMIGMHFLEGNTIDLRGGKVVISQS